MKVPIDKKQEKKILYRKIFRIIMYIVDVLFIIVVVNKFLNK